MYKIFIIQSDIIGVSDANNYKYIKKGVGILVCLYNVYVTLRYVYVCKTTQPIVINVTWPFRFTSETFATNNPRTLGSLSYGPRDFKAPMLVL